MTFISVECEDKGRSLTKLPCFMLPYDLELRTKTGFCSLLWGNAVATCQFLLCCYISGDAMCMRGFSYVHVLVRAYPHTCTYGQSISNIQHIWLSLASYSVNQPLWNVFTFSLLLDVSGIPRLHICGFDTLYAAQVCVC